MDVFSAIGLTIGEEKVYRALVSLGRTTTGPLYKEANVSQSKVYEILNRLEKKGLVSVVNKNSVNHWSASNPQIFLNRIDQDLEDLKQRRAILKKELPTLLDAAKCQDGKTEVFHGFNGYRTALLSFLDAAKDGETHQIFGANQSIPRPYYLFIQQYNQMCRDRKINLQLIYGDSMRDYVSGLFGKNKGAQVRFISGLTPTTIAIGKNQVIMITYGTKVKTIVIHGCDLANSYRVFFMSLWNMAQC